MTRPPVSFFALGPGNEPQLSDSKALLFINMMQ